MEHRHENYPESSFARVAALMESEGGKLRNRALRLGVSRHDTDDLLQNLWEKLARNAHNLETEEDLRRVAYRALERLYFDARDKQRTRDRIAPASSLEARHEVAGFDVQVTFGQYGDFAGESRGVEEAHFLDRVFAHAGDREVMQLLADGYSVRDVAAQLGVTEALIQDVKRRVRVRAEAQRAFDRRREL